MGKVQCNGNETAISDCKHEQVDHCYALEGAGVECTMEKQGNIVIEHYKLFLNDLLKSTYTLSKIE